MKKYTVTFTQYSSYEVEADNEDDAVAVAEDLFETEMRDPIANTFYDEVDVYEI